MTWRHLSLGAALMMALTTPVLTQNLAADLQRAKQREAETGDCKALLPEYARIAEQGTKADRVVAAEALLRVGICQERAGDRQAAATYQKVVNMFGDQPAAAEARLNLQPGARASSGDADTQKLLWTLDRSDWVTGPVSKDGRYLAFAGERDKPALSNYVLSVRDLRAGTTRVVAGAKPEDLGFVPDSAVFSRDGRFLAYCVFVLSEPRAWRGQLRLVDLTNPDPSAARVLLELDPSFLRSGPGSSPGPMPFDWTPDGKRIVVHRRKDATTQEIGLVATDTGAFHSLKTFVWRDSSVNLFNASLSPDGKTVAVEFGSGAGSDRDIVAIAIDDGREIPVVDFPGDDRLVGWSPDGSSILFTSARGGSQALWRQDVTGHRLTGAPAPIRPGFSATFSLGITATGALYSLVSAEPGRSVMQMEFDFSTGTVAARPTDASQTFVRSNDLPRWSHDGKVLGFLSTRGRELHRVLVIRSVDGPVDGPTWREVPLDLGWGAGGPRNWTWTPDGRSVIAVGPAGRNGLYRIDLSDATVSPLFVGPVSATRPLRWSADNRTLFYERPSSTPPASGRGRAVVTVERNVETGAERELPIATRRSPDGTKTYEGRPNTGGQAIIERNLSTGAEREVMKVYPGGPEEWHLTADGRSIIAATTELETSRPAIVEVALTDASAKVLFRGDRNQRLSLALVDPRDRSVLVRTLGSGDAPIQYWWVPLDGRPARSIDELNELRKAQDLQLRPDGRTLAFRVDHPATTGDQVFVLEGFLPRSAPQPVRR